MSFSVSVVIPTYQRPAEMVMRAVHSVLSQTLPPAEVIVVDDSPPGYCGSEDIKQAIVNLNRGDVILVRHEQNQGACAARNTGIVKAKGELIAFLDDDDEWLPEKLEKQTPLFADETVGLVYCDMTKIVLAKDGSVLRRQRRGPSFFKGMVQKRLACNNFIGSTSAVVVRKKCFDDVGLFQVELQSCQDFDMWLRISEKYAVDFVAEELVNYFCHGNEQISNNPNKRIQGIELLLETHRALYRRHPVAFSGLKYQVGRNYKKLGDNRKAILLFVKYGWAMCLLKPYVRAASLFTRMTCK